MPEEEPEPDEISTIEIYLDGPRDEGIFLGEAQIGLTSKDAFAIFGDKFSLAMLSLILKL